MASHYLFSAYMMSNYVIALLVEDRCCTQTHTPVQSEFRYSSVEESVMASVYQPREVPKQSVNEEKVCVSNV